MDWAFSAHIGKTIYFQCTQVSKNTVLWCHCDRDRQIGQVEASTWLWLGKGQGCMVLWNNHGPGKKNKTSSISWCWTFKMVWALLFFFSITASVAQPFSLQWRVGKLSRCVCLLKSMYNLAEWAVCGLRATFTLTLSLDVIWFHIRNVTWWNLN